ncbi:hypothetical protein KC851_01260 [Candidatus Kaiserbacteria bacterium]|nr:hypothetical protein [Candidatus Kaiserbacteria bacterium]
MARLLLLMTLLLTIVLPDVVSAAPLVPCNGPDCGTCQLLELGERLLDWLIGVLMVIFAILIAWAGFKMVISGGNVQAKTEARSLMTNAIIGLIIVLAAWIIVDTLIRALVPEGVLGGQSGRPWYQIECIDQNEPNSLENPDVVSDPDGNFMFTYVNASGVLQKVTFASMEDCNARRNYFLGLFPNQTATPCV